MTTSVPQEKLYRFIKGIVGVKIINYTGYFVEIAWMNTANMETNLGSNGCFH